ncbi:nitrite/sulfite reductase [Anaeromyxobacter oryzae]|uniref:Sulfite reductase n=1 Tax=Anaeromyxobacter oryzae TaxID=2918170 RepID=A0ABN6MJH3_9BACT|nr:nitrite/sulfite reductase [Anaeromyxobacter oryzae]BDG01172.1 sulfite reductase [Anaeromyxobacter oryzae]
MTTSTLPAGRARPTFADPSEIDAFVERLRRFERGELDAEGWRAYRVARGAYSQRQDGVHMLRVKIPQGLADAAQLRALADVAARFSRGFGHVTTRQNLQLHFVCPADLEPALRRLAEAGLTTAGAGGNTVRNVVTCPLAGVSADEVFDPTPYAEAATRHFLRHPLANALPRKLKIAFEGCATDHVATPIHDLGFRAAVREVAGRTIRGFRVTAAGGTSSLCTSGLVLVDFLPAADVLALAEAVVRIFHARGDRVNKARNRLKFLVRDLGEAAFRELVQAELIRVQAEGAPRLPFDPERPPEERAPALARPQAPAPAEIARRVTAAPARGPGLPPEVVPLLEAPLAALDAFRRTNVRAQRQAGFEVVTVAAPQGDLTAAQLEVLADLALAHGDGTVRLAPGGQLHLRWVPRAEVPALYAGLAAAGLVRAAGTADDIVSCPGAEACRLAVTSPRTVARFAERQLRDRLGRDALAEAAFPVHASGCPNGCSQHHLAAVGLQGSARRLGERTIPQYFVLVGGSVGETGATFGRLAAKIPARRVPDALARLVALWRAERAPGEAPGPFLARALDRARAVLAPLEELALADARAEDFVEPGSDEVFRPEVGDGECAA